MFFFPASTFQPVYSLFTICHGKIVPTKKDISLIGKKEEKMNEIRYRLPNTGEADRGNGLEKGGGGSGGERRKEKPFNIDYQNLNWILERRDHIEKSEGKDAAHQVEKTFSFVPLLCCYRCRCPDQQNLRI